MCDRDGTIALLDQMVGTTTKATARAVAAPSVNPAAQAAILAAAAVAQVRHVFPAIRLHHVNFTIHKIL